MRGGKSRLQTHPDAWHERLEYVPAAVDDLVRLELSDWIRRIEPGDAASVAQHGVGLGVDAAAHLHIAARLLGTPGARAGPACHWTGGYRVPIFEVHRSNLRTLASPP